MLPPISSSCVIVVPSSSSVTVPSILSCDVTVNVTGVPPFAVVASSVMSAGTEITGGNMSFGDTSASKSSHVNVSDVVAPPALG